MDLVNVKRYLLYMFKLWAVTAYVIVGLWGLFELAVLFRLGMIL